jgi:hypothetical protein
VPEKGLHRIEKIETFSPVSQDSGLNVLKDRQAGKDIGPLKGSAHPQAANPVRRHVGNVDILKDQPTLVYGKVPGNQVKKSCLPGPIRADDGTELPFLYGKTNPIDGYKSVEGFLYPFHAQHHRLPLENHR